MEEFGILIPMESLEINFKFLSSDMGTIRVSGPGQYL
tara:strand:+ start:851 stop:961 length:111 start_codon:yes stop_codon:yes gene_type:complete